ncbi:MAG TPA: hypothetical protein VID47_03460 [Actinomycetota bacterium]|jgi:hypothetical protein
MTQRFGEIDDMVRRSAVVLDEELIRFTGSSAASALREAVIATPPTRTRRAAIEVRPPSSTPRGRSPRRAGVRRARRIVLAALALALLLALPAFGVVQHVRSWIWGWKGPDAPVPIAADVPIASGIAGSPWTIVATQTTQGLCVYIRVHTSEGTGGSGGCGWGTDIYGSPGATPHEYGAGGQVLHWIEGTNGSGFDASVDRRIVHGVAAEQVAAVDLVLADGRVMPADVVPHPAGIDAPLSFWSAVLPAEVAGVDLTGAEDDVTPVHELIARDADGSVLERRVVDRPNG